MIQAVDAPIPLTFVVKHSTAIMAKLAAEVISGGLTLLKGAISATHFVL